MVDMTGVIYTLQDPRTGTIRYLGFTKGAPLLRYRAHLNEARCWRNRGMKRFVNKGKNKWILELLDAGLAPVCHELLRGVPQSEAQRWEYAAIKVLERHGAQLTNRHRGTMAERYGGYNHG